MPFLLLVVTVALATQWAPPDRPAPATSPDLTVKAARCGWGGVGPSIPGKEPLYVSLEFDLLAGASAEVVTLDALELVEATGVRVGGVVAPALRVPGRTSPDAWPPGTVVWNGALEPGEARTVRAFGKLDQTWERLPAGPFRCRATLRYHGSKTLPVLTGDAWAWPTG